MNKANNCSIAIFDSGFGGLSVMRAIREVLPHENILYLGDTANLPYGNKSAETILRHSLRCCSFLMSEQIKLLVIACNSACSARAVEHLQQIYPIPVIGVISPVVERIPQILKETEEILILGTRATITSGIYKEALLHKLPKLRITAIACPLFVPLIEEGYAEHPLMELSIKEYLHKVDIKNFNTILLGCTHYPLLKPTLQKVLGEGPSLLDPAIFCAKEINEYLIRENLLNPQKTSPLYRFFVSDDPEKFRLLGKTFLQHPIQSVVTI